ncbi:MAG: DUF4363 family protein [Eubacteriales bacterium]|nr:DUF4363 family protein [Eubacteriales bacterium]
MKFVIIQRTCTILFVLFLVFIFIFPSYYIKTTCIDVSAHIDAALEAAQNGDLTTAHEQTVVLGSILDKRVQKIKWFVNHSIVNEVILEANLANESALENDQNAVIAALIALQNSLDVLSEIELFDGNNIL